MLYIHCLSYCNLQPPEGSDSPWATVRAKAGRGWEQGHVQPDTVEGVGAGLALPPPGKPSSQAPRTAGRKVSAASHNHTSVTPLAKKIQINGNTRKSVRQPAAAGHQHVGLCSEERVHAFFFLKNTEAWHSNTSSAETNVTAYTRRHLSPRHATLELSAVPWRQKGKHSPKHSEEDVCRFTNYTCFWPSSCF